MYRILTPDGKTFHPQELKVVWFPEGSTEYTSSLPLYVSNQPTSLPHRIYLPDTEIEVVRVDLPEILPPEDLAESGPPEDLDDGWIPLREGDRLVLYDGKMILIEGTKTDGEA